MAMKVRFNALIKPSKKSFAQLQLPPSAVTALKLDGRRLRVHGTINGYSLAEEIHPEEDGAYIIYLTSVICRTIHIQAGDTVELAVEAAEDDRPLNPPSDFKKALEQNDDSRRMFEMYSYTNKRDILEWINDATTENVRSSRVERAMVKLGQEYLEYLDSLPKPDND